MPEDPRAGGARHLVEPARGRDARQAARLRWWITFGLQALVIVCWSLSTPLNASPDEPAHTIKAAAVARGDWLGVPQYGVDHSRTGNTAVEAPIDFALANPGCFAMKPTVPASCFPVLPSSHRDVLTVTTAGTYPPGYYLVVGLPSLLWPDPTGLRMMRILSGFLCAALLASALASAAFSRRRQLLVWGVVAATTPMTLFLGATVNPSGLEISSAICLWVSALVLVLDGTLDRRLMARVGISAAVFAQIRVDSLFWLALIALGVLALGNVYQVRTILRDRVARIWMGVIGLSCFFELAWLQYSHALGATSGTNQTPLPVLKNLELSLGMTDLLMHEMVGVLGWLDTFPPALTFYGWLTVIGVLVGLGMVLGTRRGTVVLFVMAGTVVVLPVLLQSAERAQVGQFWQGRYTLPLAVGLPIMASALIPVDALPRTILTRLRFAFAAVLAVAQGAMFLLQLRRYSVGLGGTLDFYFHPLWNPPLGVFGITVVFAIALLAWTAWVTILSAPPPRSLAAAQPGERGGGPVVLATSRQAAP